MRQNSQLITREISSKHEADWLAVVRHDSLEIFVDPKPISNWKIGGARATLLPSSVFYILRIQIYILFLLYENIIKIII